MHFYEIIFNETFERHLFSAHGRVSIAQDVSFYCNKGDCKMGFPRISKLEEHIRMHENILTNCFFCPWTGVTVPNISIHFNTHFHYRTDKCSHCDELFYTPWARDKHEEIMHERDSKKFSCDDCAYTTHSTTSLNYHLRTKHSKNTFGDTYLNKLR
jgi:hypothetical protein